MNIICFNTYILICLLTRGHGNLFLKVRAADVSEDGGEIASVEQSDSTSASLPANIESEEDKKKALDKIIAILDEAINESALAFPPSESKDKDSSEVIKLYKENDSIEMTNNDFLQDDFMGNYTYAFKPGVECILVMFDDKNVWRRGDGKVDLPKSVTYDTVLSEVAVRDAEKTAFFKKDEETGEWKHVVTMSRERKPKVLHRSS